MENGWWCRLPLNINMSACEMDSIMSSTGEIFSLPDAAARVIFAAAGLRKLHSDGRSHSAISNSVEDFKSKKSFR